MSDSSNTNPFVLPGLGQGGDLAGNPLLASMEMMRKAWAGLAGPGGLAQALPMAAPMNPEDLERRIADLRTVENWLRMNLSMLTSTIQGLEVQRATIATLRSFVGGGAAAGGEASPLEVALGLKPAAARSAAPPGGDAPAEPASPDAGAADQVSQAAQSASQAWWNLLQQQFNQLAAATAATMPDSAAQDAASRAAAPAAKHNDPAPPGRAPRKAAAKRTPAPRKS